MAVQLQVILKAFPDLLSHISGELSIEVKQPSPQENPAPHGIAFTSDPQYLSALSQSALSVVVVSNALLGKAKELKFKPALVSSPSPYLAMAKVNMQFFSLPFLFQPFEGQPRHSTAVVHSTAKVAKSATLGPGVVLHEGVSIGERTFIGANTVVEANVEIGSDCKIHPMVYIGHTTVIGNRVEIKPQSTISSDGFGYAQDAQRNSFRLPHYGALIIEDDVHVGSNVNIDRGTFEKATISRGTKIDNHCHFGHNVFVGENCLITAGFISAGSARIGDRCTFAGRSGVNGKTEICSDVTIGPNSAVTNDITKPGVYGGFPPIPMRDFLKSSTTFASLPRMRKNISRMMKHLGLEGDDSKS